MSEMVVLCILGTSGSGKSTIAKELERRKIPMVVSHRTRDRRPKEEHGVDGYFITRDQFIEMDKQEAFCAKTEYAGNLYGLGWGELGHFKMMGKEVVSYVVDVTGLETLKRELDGNDSYRVVSVGICSSEEMVRSRMAKRGDENEKIEERMNNHYEEQSSVLAAVDYVVANPNGKLQMSVRDIIKIIEREKA